MLTKQGKAVVDAVNYFKGADSPNSCTHIITPTKLNTCYQQGALEFDICNEDNSRWDNICTIEEFNQCVKEMSEHAGADEFENYTAAREFRTASMVGHPIKPRTKIEYEKVDASEAVYYFTETDCELYPSPDDNIKACSLQDYINELAAGEDSIYRRVETEIKTETRYICYDEKGNFIIEHKGGTPVAAPCQVFKITVEV